MSRIVVVGGGYGGALVAKELDADAEVVLVDPRDAFVNVAGGLRALTRPDWAPNIFFPFDGLLDRGRVVRDRAVSVDSGGVELSSGERVEGDYLVLATGSSYPYPIRPKRASTADALADLRASHGELSRAGRVLILGAGAVGVELAGEIKEVWPEKQVTVVDPTGGLIPRLLPEVRDDLCNQLDKLGVELRLDTGLTALPPTEPGRFGPFTATTGDGGELAADIWFRAFGVRVNSDYLADGRLVALTGSGTVPVTERLQVQGYEHVYALGDLADLPDPKMASYAQTQAPVVVRNIRAQLAGERAEAVHRPMPALMILLPLGTRGGVGQLPAADGVAPATFETVSQRKGADLFTARFRERFGLR
ncbi:NAD(P)/FAD-dependent oxidoreductase [Amycolatopsis sacchari]|uniref:NADH dehydrogenase, FAD-containing subunit n=1 Tax=Amycolatopsis sacchari TaxID=115433 RepID=A0A1I3X2E8_9PSEU|nr:FAD-dependent oxidoreductase [Amycolatopsis sacchari]SFK13938.1 NADH dehydrogenase, FAD-containing subunit [Amycolatopsis sacchari]